MKLVHIAGAIMFGYKLPKCLVAMLRVNTELVANRGCFRRCAVGNRSCGTYPLTRIFRVAPFLKKAPFFDVCQGLTSGQKPPDGFDLTGTLGLPSGLPGDVVITPCLATEDESQAKSPGLPKALN